MKKRPNILFLMTDEQRHDCLGSVNPVVKTPHLDSLASQGIQFTRAYTTNPSCVPARASMMTGKLPSQCSSPTFLTHLPDSETTFMTLLQEAGYYTAVTGKQHFASSQVEHGYDYEDIIDEHMPPKVLKDGSSYVHFLKNRGHRTNQKLTKEVGRFCEEWIGQPEEYVDSYVGDKALKWLQDKRPKGQPWFKCISFLGPHMPYDGLGLREESKYSEDEIDLPKTYPSDLKNKPSFYKANAFDGEGNPARNPSGHFTEKEIKQTRLSYYSNMTAIDNKIGAIVSCLKEIGEYENTVIFFTSDHGDFMGDFGMLGKGQYLSEVLIRVPFIVKPPIENYKGQLKDEFVSNMDIAATCLRLASAPIPESMQSCDLSLFWEEPYKNWGRNHLYTEAQELRSIRNEQFKLIHYSNRNYGELYNLTEDPDERFNLWDLKDYTQIKIHLLSSLITEMTHSELKIDSKWNKHSPSV